MFSTPILWIHIQYDYQASSNYLAVYISPQYSRSDFKCWHSFQIKYQHWDYVSNPQQFPWILPCKNENAVIDCSCEFILIRVSGSDRTLEKIAAMSSRLTKGHKFYTFLCSSLLNGITQSLRLFLLQTLLHIVNKQVLHTSSLGANSI